MEFFELVFRDNGTMFVSFLTVCVLCVMIARVFESFSLMRRKPKTVNKVYLLDASAIEHLKKYLKDFDNVVTLEGTADNLEEVGGKE